jgi:hypothetical protein
MDQYANEATQNFKCIFEVQERARRGGGGGATLELAVNYDPRLIALLKEDRILGRFKDVAVGRANMRFAVNSARASYPSAVSL